METGQPIPSSEAANIAANYDKQIVIITAFDLEHGYVHTATYGTEDNLKVIADSIGREFNQHAGGQIERAKHFEKLPSYIKKQHEENHNQRD